MEWYGVMGDPIAHSLSPQMHRYWFEKYGRSAHYLAFHVTREHLGQAVEGLKVLGAGGFNVTVPHKSSVMPFLDAIDEDAALIGAVNTVVRADDDRLIGYNTDGIGFLQSLRKHVPSADMRGRPLLVLGAGGAAKAVALTLAKYLAGRVDIANRTLAKAAALAAACRRFCPSEAMSLADAARRLERYDLVVNATSIGLYPDLSAAPIHLQSAKKGTLFADLIYRPARTAFLREAESCGNPVMNGLPMLIEQGAAAFEKWTGIRPETAGMEERLRALLKKGERSSTEHDD